MQPAASPGSVVSRGGLSEDHIEASIEFPRVAAKYNVMGRPEKRYHARIFQRPAPWTYALTPAMRDAILDLAN